MVEKIIFKSIIDSISNKLTNYYISTSNKSEKNCLLSAFLTEGVGSKFIENWKNLIENTDMDSNFTVNRLFISCYFDANKEKKYIRISYNYDENFNYEFSADFLLKILAQWGISVRAEKKEYPFLELNIDWEQETFEFIPLEHWIDPHKAEKDAYAQSVINKFLARVEEWKKQNPDD